MSVQTDLSASTPGPTIRLGARGDAVRRLQEALVAAGAGVDVDGSFGPATERAVREIQTRHGIDPDGVAGPRTWRALDPTAITPTEPRGPSLTLSAAGARFIAEFEGFRPTLYNDPAGHCTIGYGTLVHRGNCDGSEGEEFRGGITRDRALALLQASAAKAGSEINRLVHVSLQQHQFDALVSFAYNVGTGAFGSSTLLRELNAGHYDAVPAQLERWAYAGHRQLPGLIRRRRAEGALFRDGTY